ncbi:FtsP/CotA-like multicopper oxidase with cupredoxin domain [Pseudonocardia autotrophica]|uniref:Multicopper oxidase with three cupredoxin domains (Includes cell division protein FtsP and spore coat protein CotA) n=3 Tax=Pseudonocardia TaxID=1847 RepID=A0A1I5GZD2_PSUAM|nr:MULTISPECIES: multicopper oxidase family protein [Pseudonocardia]GEC26875.1 copper oxidase [Pseudonocardia saturnea]OSY36654.1 Multicopper oxidase mco [Pseudonocardia autotrophica]TDN65482.1 FtsP/CotA-like multicopper oxidase with cupredoxin domain [Pseudonocardia autotrophica]SFO41136.1 Multicopper oxidase with three cupredoxin domains (includes cell division protein FtsP and spore coat protein CotA) [Pseudonocardia ammonioxydans]BBG05905.1 copper oxidase [Pseudonocardia autotrophica]
MSAATSISRRRALGLAGLGAAAVAAGATGWLGGFSGAGTGRLRLPAGEPLQDPAVAPSRSGRLAVELTAAPGARLGGQDTAALGYNGSTPGPTLRVRPGDELAVRLTNRLDQPTNLHTHGLRVSPQANSDNPFVRVDPGTSFDYLYRIPPDHPAGTFWYHPHHHGVVADQVFAGLAGVLLVDPHPGPGAPEPAVSTDRVLLITDTTLDSGGQIVDPTAMDRAMGRQGEMVLVNGQYQPTIPATPGATQRWRVINGCVSRALAIGLQDHQLGLIAYDGTFLPAPATRDRVVLAPGNRADVVVRPGAAGPYALRTDPVERGGMGGMMGGGTATSGPTTLATMIAAGTPVTAPPLPAALPAETPAAGGASAQRQITFQMGMGGMAAASGMSFTVDGRTFDPQRDDQTVELGAIEDWLVTNPSPLAHPFHLHVWPFTVLATSDGTPPLGVPQDVVLVPAQGWARIRIPFTTHPGRSVYHCHILDHEDAGMMATINVRA